MNQHPVDDGGQMIGRRATPTRQGRSVKIDATPTVDLALAVKRQMIGIFGHGHMGERALGRQSTFDQPVTRRSVGRPDRRSGKVGRV